MYRWWLYAHIASVVGFLIVHGILAAMGLSLPQQKSHDSVRSLTELSRNSTGISYIFLVSIVGTGVALGFQASWWRYKWIWAALGVLILTIGAMSGLANRYNQMRTAAGRDPSNRRTAAAVTTADLTVMVSRANPWPISIIGVVALLLLLWLMILKPF